MYQREKEYTVYLSILSKKLKVKVFAFTAKEAKQKALNLVSVDKVEPNITNQDINWGDPSTWFK